MQRSRSLWLFALALAPWSSLAWSASLHVSPVSLRLVPGQAAVGLTLSNVGEQPLVAQVRLFGWTQDISDDHLSAQQELVVSPPIATIAAHGEQVVRIVRPARAAPGQELAYRLLIDELPDSAAHGGDAAVDIRIRYSVPLFVQAAGVPGEPRLSWSLTQRDGDWFLKALNSGPLHAQLSAVKLTLADGSTLKVADGLLGYALPGCAREWRLPTGGTHAAPTAGQFGREPHVLAAVNGRAIDAPVALTSTDSAH